MTTSEPTSRPVQAGRIAQAAWVLYAVVALGLYLLGSATYFRELETLCTAGQAACHERELVTPADLPQLTADGLSLRAWAVAQTAYRSFISLVFVAIALVIFARKHREWPGLLFSFCLLGSGLIGGAFDSLIAVVPVLTPLVLLIRFPTYVGFALFFVAFPNGRVAPRIMWLPLGLWSMMFFLGQFFLWPPPGSALSNILAPLGWLGLLVSGALAQVYRYRRISTPLEQRQTKWVVLAMGVIAVLVTALYASPLRAELDVGASHSLRRLVILISLNLLLTLIPISVGIAILRHGLFDIDLIIRRTLIYSVLTGVLALVYFGSVVVIEGLLRGLTGGESPLVIVLSTLLIAALFVPLRTRVQQIIDRRFYRRKYDAARTLTAFGQQARDETDLVRLSDRLRGVVQETMQPASLNLWLKENRPR